MNDALSSQICLPHYQFSPMGQNLCQLVNSRVPAPRPVPVMQPQRIGFTGGQTLKIRCPDIGETGLSKAEIEVAISEGITAL